MLYGSTLFSPEQLTPGKGAGGIGVEKLVFFLGVVAILGSGCVGESKETTVKCPKCGAIFTIQEGLGQYQMQAH